MSPYKFFSEQAVPLTLVREAVPERVRFAVANGIKKWVDEDLLDGLLEWIVNELDWDPELLDDSWEPGEQLVELFRKELSWTDFFDGCGAIFYYLRDEADQEQGAVSFRDTLNRALNRHHSAYEMDEAGLVVEPGLRVTEAAVAEARALLTSPDMAGPDRQYAEAIYAFRRRPNPNYEIAVAGAINALEAVCRVVLEDKDITLSRAIERIRRDKGLHSALAESIVKIYGYASDAGGRHGLVGEPDADRKIAEFCLHQTAATIVLVARLYGYAIEES